MRKYELSISADYVPEWGVVEAVREFFQNSIDEEQRDPGNKMFFEYDKEGQVIRIGNKHSELDIQSLLFGSTTKRDDVRMIGAHGEGYKIATVVLLRLGKEVVFNNYVRKEVWRPRLVKSRRYGGVLVPTFFVEEKPVWSSVPDHSLTIEISGITEEEYEEVIQSNLHLQDQVDRKETEWGDVLEGEDQVGRIYVGGLFICEDDQLEIGVDFKPKWVRLERDRSMVNSFDVKWYIGRMVDELKDKDLSRRLMDSYAGEYIHVEYIPDDLVNELVEEFLKANGVEAVPVSDQSELEPLAAIGYKGVIVPAQKCAALRRSEYFTDLLELIDSKLKRPSLAERFDAFIQRVQGKLTVEEMEVAGELLHEIERLG